MPGVVWTQEEINFLRDQITEYGYSTAQIERIASHLMRPFTGVKSKAAELKLNKVRTFKPEQPPSAHRSILELLEAQRSNYERKRDHYEAKKRLEVNLPDDKPYGILLIGDPHVDDNGCDIEALMEALSVGVREAVYAINIGDLTNNWIGGLARLYAHQNATDDEAVKLIDWLLSAVPWVGVILGNHDKWGPIATIKCQDLNVPYVSHGGVWHFISGNRTCLVDARHTHRGNSQYNPAHGQIKKSYRGSPCDVIVGGHTHTSAYTVLRNGVSGKINHCIRVGSYKKYDDYADANGFDADTIAPHCLLLVDPQASEEGFVTLFWDLEKGYDYLEWKRR